MYKIILKTSQLYMSPEALYKVVDGHLYFT
jgi:hypothetical protein